MIDEGPPEQPEDEQASAAVPGAADSIGTDKPRRESNERKTRREIDAFWDFVFDTPVGRAEMWKLIGPQGAHAFESRFMSGAVGFPDTNATWYARGEQDFGLRLYHAWLLRNPLKVALMHQENDTRFTKPKRRRGDKPHDTTGE